MVRGLSARVSTGLLPGVVWGGGIDVSSPLARGDTATLQHSLDRGVSQLENVLPHFGRVSAAEWQWCGSSEAAQGRVCAEQENTI